VLHDFGRRLAFHRYISSVLDRHVEPIGGASLPGCDPVDVCRERLGASDVTGKLEALLLSEPRDQLVLLGNVQRELGKLLTLGGGDRFRCGLRLLNEQRDQVAKPLACLVRVDGSADLQLANV
jgi:hypothetical protein